MKKIIRTTNVTDPETFSITTYNIGDIVSPEHEDMITNPACFKLVEEGEEEAEEEEFSSEDSGFMINNYDQMSPPELRNALAQRGLTAANNARKSDLVKILREADAVANA